MSGYGYCPICNTEGVATEKRINGNTICKNGHSAPRSMFLNPTGKEQVEIEIAKGAKVGNITINKESLLVSLSENIYLQKLNNITARDIKNAFMANYITALLMLKLQDIKGLMIINDHSHANLTKFSANMSDLNFWGRALFYSNDVEIKSRLKDNEAKILSTASSRVTTARIQKMMKAPMTSPDSIDWNETIASVLMLQHVFNIQSSYCNSILRTLLKWDSLNIGAKQKSVNDALMFMLQSDPSSILVPHLRKLSTLIMSQKIENIAQKIVSFRKLNETDGDCGTSTSAVATSSNAIINPTSINSQTGHADTSQDMQNTLGGLYKLRKMSPNQVTKKGKFTIRAGKLIKRKVKGFMPKKFKSPDFLKPVKEEPKEKEDA